jgi:hypothetical protein
MVHRTISSRAKRITNQLNLAQTASSNLNKIISPSTGRTDGIVLPEMINENFICPIDDGSLSQAISTLEELDWCLEQLETMQTHKSVSDLASLKVRARRIILFCILLSL